MAKVKLGNVSPGATPLVRGSFLIKDTKHGAIAQKWPKKRGLPKTPYDKYKQDEFGVASWMAANPHWLDFGTAVEMVKGTTYVPRDFLIRCAYGYQYRIVGVDGVEWPVYRDMAPNPQYVLDLITTDIGSMIWRSPAGWIGIPGGGNGDQLNWLGGMPQWAQKSSANAGYWTDVTDLGTITGGTVVPDPSISGLYTYKNNGAHTLDVPLVAPLDSASVRFKIVNGNSPGVISYPGYQGHDGIFGLTPNQVYLVDAECIAGFNHLKIQDAGNITPPGWNTVSQVTLLNDDPGWNGYTLRQRIDHAVIANAGLNKVRCRFQAAAASAGLICSAAYIGMQAASGDPYDFATTPTQLLFGGNPNFSISVGGVITSDAATFSIVPGGNLIVSMQFNGTSSGLSVLTASGWQSYYKLGADAATVNASGYTAYRAAFCLDLVEAEI